MNVLAWIRDSRPALLVKTDVLGHLFGFVVILAFLWENK